MVDITGAQLKSFSAYLAEREASTTGVSMVPGLNGAGTGVVALTNASLRASTGITGVLGLQADGIVVADPGPYNAKNFRAVADVDDTASLQRAIDAAGLAGGGTVTLSGVFSISAKIDLVSHVHLQGLGQAIIRPTAGADMAIGGAFSGKAIFSAQGQTKFSIQGIETDSSLIIDLTGGYRDVFCYECTDYTVMNNTFTTAGAAVASLGSSNYIVGFNRVTCNSSDGSPHHDGIIDNWQGSHDFLIIGNTLHCEEIGPYAILVTGQNTDASPAAIYNFVITGNKIIGAQDVGIWVQGRQGHASRFSVTDNIVDGVRDFWGIGIMDAFDFSITGNKTNNTGSCGIRVGKETTGGAGDYGARDGFIGFNSIQAPNALVGAGEAGWAISSDHADNLNLTFFRNTVRGANHTYAMGVRGSRIKITGREWDIGSDGTATNRGINDGATGVEKGISAYSPTVTGLVNVSAASNASSNYEVKDGYVTIYGRISVTPTAAANADTQVSISLPVASNFGNTADAIGTGTSSFGLVCSVNADTTNDYLVLRFPAPNTSSNSISFQVTYRII